MRYEDALKYAKRYLERQFEYIETPDDREALLVQVIKTKTSSKYRFSDAHEGICTLPSGVVVNFPIEDEAKRKQALLNLLESAKHNYHSHKALRDLLAEYVGNASLNDPEIRSLAKNFMLGDPPEPPKTTGKVKPAEEFLRRAVGLAVVNLVLKGYKPVSRNDSSPPFSACDAVAQALQELGQPLGYGRVKNIFYSLKKGQDLTPL